MVIYNRVGLVSAVLDNAYIYAKDFAELQLCSKDSKNLFEFFCQLSVHMGW